MRLLLHLAFSVWTRVVVATLAAASALTIVDISSRGFEQDALSLFAGLVPELFPLTSALATGDLHARWLATGERRAFESLGNHPIAYWLALALPSAIGALLLGAQGPRSLAYAATGLVLIAAVIAVLRAWARFKSLDSDQTVTRPAVFVTTALLAVPIHAAIRLAGVA